ncbi:universal stress protein [Streptomyces sp. NPDC052042]|uniref:universal stress protein n=1 Tax=Streptomyces sp. NPDC052042 TaxID=3365683 RepID=UPI0037D75A43
MEGITGRPELGSVVVGVDGSEPARRAVFWAADEAARRGTLLHIVHGADTDTRSLYLSADSIEGIRSAGHELLRDIAAVVAERFPDLRVTTEFSRSAPVPSLQRTAGLRGTLVVGSRGLGGFAYLMLGSVGLRIVGAATTPVVVVRGEDDTVAGVVVAAVRDEHDAESVRYAACEAEIRGASLRLLHVWNVFASAGVATPMLDGAGTVVGERVRRLTDLTARIREEFPGLTVQAEAEKSLNTAGALVEASRHADLLVMGGRRSPGYIGPTLGRVTHGLVHHAHCPVQLIPRGHGSEA